MDVNRRPEERENFDDDQSSGLNGLQIIESSAVARQQGGWTP